MPAKSPRRASEAAERQAAVHVAILRDRGCRARLLWPELGCAGDLVGHEPGRRKGDGSHLDPDRIVAVCWAHHQAIHAHPALAYERGLLWHTHAAEEADE